MANATVGTTNTLVENGFLADPAGDTLDTGTAAVTLLYDVGGKSADVFFRVKNTAAANAAFSVNAGTYPPAMRSGLGSFAGAALAQNAVGWYGPFDSGQFIQSGANAGKLSITVTPASGTITANVACFVKPKAS